MTWSGGRYYKNIHMSSSLAGNAGTAIREQARQVDISLLKRHKLIDAESRKKRCDYLLSIKENWKIKILDSVDEYIKENSYRKLNDEDRDWVDQRADLFCRNAISLKKGILGAKSDAEMEASFDRFDKAMAKEFGGSCAQDRSRPYQHELVFGAKSAKRE